jgi:hypothetical protein
MIDRIVSLYSLIYRFEDGTIDFYGVAALSRGFDDLVSFGKFALLELLLGCFQPWLVQVE